MIRGGLARTALRGMAYLCGGLVLAGQLGRFAASFDTLNALLLPLVAALALLSILALACRERVSGIVAFVCLAIGLGQIASPASPEKLPATWSPPPIRLLTLSTWHSNPHPEAVRRAVEAERPDIALLQETDRATAAVVRDLLPGYHRVRSCSRRDCSLTILSRWPARRIVLAAKPGARLADLLVAEIAAPWGSFRVMNLHLPRPYTPDAQPFVDQLAIAMEEQGRGPLIVGGDFNMATGSFGLRRLAGAAGLRRVEGLLPTYPAHLGVPPFIPIDHVLVGRDWGPAQCHAMAWAASDHRGIACTLSLSPSLSPRPRVLREMAGGT